MLDHYDAIHKKTLDKFMPFKVDWEITYRCNLRCSHCYQTGPSGEEELSTEKVYSVLDELADLGSLYLTFTGGEILLRRDFFDIARYARKREFALRLFTNGTLIDEEVADKIKALNTMAVEISLYGMDPASHEGITLVKGSFDKTMRGFRLLKERGVNVIVKSTIMKENLSQFDRLMDFSRELNTKFIYTFTVIPKIDRSKEILRHRLDEKDLEELFQSHKWLMDGVNEGGVQNYKPLCAAGINSIYISPYGEVFPCVVLREDCGTLRDHSLKEIWNSEYFKKIRDIEFKDLGECSSCADAGYCDRCAGLALWEGGGLLAPSPNECRLANIRKQFKEKERRRGEEREEEVLQAA